jgi:hypothetical protein
MVNRFSAAMSICLVFMGAPLVVIYIAYHLFRLGSISQELRPNTNTLASSVRVVNPARLDPKFEVCGLRSSAVGVRKLKLRAKMPLQRSNQFADKAYSAGE